MGERGEIMRKKIYNGETNVEEEEEGEGRERVGRGQEDREEEKRREMRRGDDGREEKRK